MGVLMFLARGLLAAAALAAVGPGDQDPGRKMSEYELKAEFLHNFAKYVEWPEGSFEKDDSPIVIGIVGADPFGAILEKALKDRTAQERKFSIVRFKDADEIKRCHILFVPRMEKPRLEEIRKRLGDWPVLTVGEEERFAKSGGLVNILIQDQRPRLEINVEAAERVKLTIQARLLKLATIVKAEK